MKVNITPPPPLATKSVMILTLPPPLPGLQNDTDLQYSEDTKLESKESSDYIYFHK